MKNAKFSIGALIVIVAIGMSIYGAINNFQKYFSNRGYDYETVYGVVTQVFATNTEVQYQVDNTYYKGIVNGNYLEPNDFIELYYDKTNPQKVGIENYPIYLNFGIGDLLISLFGLSFLAYALYKKNQIKNHSERKPVELTGYDNGRLVFKEKEPSSARTKLYFSKGFYIDTEYKELVANNKLDAELVYSTKHPSMWSLDLTKIEEVLKDEKV
jgi:hypothetical protein